MSRIQLLSEEVASQVAAGEVVERPASVVKELVENSIDAGAKKIEVMIRGGGNSLIRVVDDGSGMDCDDALLCLERHATSKIRTGNDLAEICTLGFRGEALPSIASVSRFRLTTREHGSLAGTEISIRGGKIDFVRDGGDAPGTQIEVRSLFFNLPARRKFLRTENTEASQVEHQLLLQAVGRPQIGFILIKNDRLVYQLPPVSDLRDRIRDLCGADLAGQLLEVPTATRDGITISGFIGRAGVSRSTRAQQITFLNGRAVENPALNYALREGYHTALMKGQFPVTFLFIEMDPAAVDVNVHPAKREVRFREPSVIREALTQTVRAALESGRASWNEAFTIGAEPASQQASEADQKSTNDSGLKNQKPISSPADLQKPTSSTSPLAKSFSQFDETPPLIPAHEQVALRRDWTAISTTPAQSAHSLHQENSPKNLVNREAENAQKNETAAVPDSAGTGLSRDFRILGVLGKLYVLMENRDGLVLVDQHAAHERILFEELRRRMEDQGVPMQRLLMPLTMQLAARDADWITRNLATLQKMGIGIEPFGAGTFKVDALPQFIRVSDPLQLIHDIIDELSQTSAVSSKLRLGEDVIATTVCHHAVKASDVLREPELVRLIQDLLACELPYCCPHGRPTMIRISYGELEKKFGRKV